MQKGTLKALTDAFMADTGIRVLTFSTGTGFEQHFARTTARCTLPDIMLNDTTSMGQMRQSSAVR